MELTKSTQQLEELIGMISVFSDDLVNFIQCNSYSAG